MFVLFFFHIYIIDSHVVKGKIDICTNLDCDDAGEQVCGIKTEGAGFRLKLFPSECDLLRTGCDSDKDSVYGVISMDYCIQAFKINPNGKIPEIIPKESCKEYNCSNSIDGNQVCGIKQDGQGFRIRLFRNNCQLLKYNCENQLDFTVTDLHICNGMDLSKSTAEFDESVKDDSVNINNQDSIENLIILSNSSEINENSSDNDLSEHSLEINGNFNYNDLYELKTTVDEQADDVKEDIKNVVVVRSSFIDFNQVNETIENFFAATHIFDLPVREMDRSVINETTRRRLVKVAGPVRVFVPWVTIPKNISDDFDHTPTLSTCYHKCPRKCPETYAPVCGVPGIVAREPSLMFQNHCFMDVAQCKMYWENKSPTSLSSSYVESSFLFCLGDEMNGMYRFLPLIKTLQHMGRLRKKGRYHYRFNNMKFFNNLLPRQPKFMGR